MKRLFIIIVLSIITVYGIFAQELVLDEAITRAVITIEEELPQRASLLLLNIVSPSTAFSNYVLNELTDRLVINRKLAVVDRQNLNAIRQEMNFQYSGEVSDESMVSIGRMLGAHYIVTGTLDERGVNYRLRIRIIVVETARIHTSIILDIKNNAQVARLIGGERAAQEIERKQQEEERARPTSNVRDNWVSADLAGCFIFGFNQSFGIAPSIRYERMLGPYISLGANFFWYFPIYELDGNIWGGDASFRVYPFGKKFYIGLALGYHELGTETRTDDWKRWDVNKWADEIAIISYKGSGFAVSVEFGWKIDVGQEGGFFLQTGALASLMFGNTEITNIKNPDPNYDYKYTNIDDYLLFTNYYRIYFGAGWAF